MCSFGDLECLSDCVNCLRVFVCIELKSWSVCSSVRVCEFRCRVCDSELELVYMLVRLDCELS